jgi:hypothetical protein
MARRLGSKERIHRRKNETVLTLTGLLMEGMWFSLWSSGVQELSAAQYILVDKKVFPDLVHVAESQTPMKGLYHRYMTLTFNEARNSDGRFLAGLVDH